ncbi:unnamed protein product, partial [Allacma fusca]
MYANTYTYVRGQGPHRQVLHFVSGSPPSSPQWLFSPVIESNYNQSVNIIIIPRSLLGKLPREGEANTDRLIGKMIPKKVITRIRNISDPVVVTNRKKSERGV